ncbi:MAG TPA: hypothetical protein PLZ52_09580 [Bacteroidales bacterium]|nr:hypothetical protein [Bacteroidales bacterium]HOE05457.1 hypothetical protein [Bacteroidales bacterium]HQL69350.1 hypothetical protein [Bacteroidales bacterium]
MTENSTLVLLVDNQSKPELLFYDANQPLLGELSHELDSIEEEPDEKTLATLFEYIRSSSSF